MTNTHDKHEHRHKFGKIGPSYLFCEYGELSFIVVVFETVLGRNHSEKV